MSLVAQGFLKLLTPKDLRKCIKSFVFEKPLAVNVLTSPKNCCNLQKSSFILLSPHFEPT